MLYSKPTSESTTHSKDFDDCPTMDDMLEEAQHLRLEGSKLKGVLKNNDGGWHNSELDLDKYIGNTNGKSWGRSPVPCVPHANPQLTRVGHLTWFGQGFSNDAKDIKLARHRHKPELVATLRKDDGSEIMNQLLLGEKIENADGNFSVRRDRSGSAGVDPFWRQNMSLGV